MKYKNNLNSKRQVTTFNTTSKFISDMEANENDRPITITEDLQILEEAGLKYPSIFWLEYREVVFGAVKDTI